MSSLFYFHQLERLIILFSFLLSVERYDYAKKLTAVISDLYKVSNLELICLLSSSNDNEYQLLHIYMLLVKFILGNFF